MNKGHITISLIRSNLDSDHMRIQIEDDSSRIHFLEARLGVEDFMRALAGRGYIDCEFELRGVENVGKILETKQENVFVEDGDYAPLEWRVRCAVERFEINGWTGRNRDAMNHHRANRKIPCPEGKEGVWYAVTFHRHVNPE